MDPVRTGLVGYGFGGRYFHAPLISAAQECELVGVVTRSADAPGPHRRRAPGRRHVRVAGGPGRGRGRGGGHLHAGRHALGPD